MRLAKQVDGVVGVTAVHVESGNTISLNGNQRFPMASVFKLAVALRIFRQIDTGALRLNQELTLTPKDFRAGNSPLAEMAKNTPVAFSLERLLIWMLAEGDNSAADVLLRLAGGPQEVTANLRSTGITGMDVNRNEAEVFFDLAGISDRPSESEYSLDLFKRLAAAQPAAKRKEAEEEYARDLRDTTTPDAMANLLSKLEQRKVGLSNESVERLLTIMQASVTGTERIRGRLPIGTRVADKTGGAAGSRNDVGIIQLPDGLGHIAIAVFIKGSQSSDVARDQVIADISRLIYDYFVLDEPSCLTRVRGRNKRRRTVLSGRTQ